MENGLLHIELTKAAAEKVIQTIEIKKDSVMYTKQAFKKLTADIVYLKPVETSDLPEDIQVQAEGLETLFAVHNGKLNESHLWPTKPSLAIWPSKTTCRLSPYTKV